MPTEPANTVFMPSPFSKYTTSSVATLPLAPCAYGQPPRPAMLLSTTLTPIYHNHHTANQTEKQYTRLLHQKIPTQTARINKLVENSKSIFAMLPEPLWSYTQPTSAGSVS